MSILMIRIVSMSVLKDTTHRYFAYNVARIRVADEDKVMSQQELTDYIMERQSNEGVWGAQSFRMPDKLGR